MARGRFLSVKSVFSCNVTLSLQVKGDIINKIIAFKLKLLISSDKNYSRFNGLCLEEIIWRKRKDGIAS